MVLLGTQNNDFFRLLSEIEKNIKLGNINEPVIVQAGYTKFKSDCMRIFSMIPKEKLEDYVSKSNFVITHAGVGSIEMALKYNKKVIAVPRLKKYGEHVNDHQIEIEKEFNHRGWILGIDDVSELGDALKKMPKFIPKKYYNNKDKKIVNIIKNYINKI